MKKYPAIKFILITVVSGICGAVLSFLLSFQQAALVSAIQSLSRMLGSALPALHLSVCLFLSGMSVFFTSKLRRQIARSNPQNQEELFEQIESNDHCTEILTINTLSVILNFFFLGVSFVYKNPQHILISAAAALLFLTLNTWVEVSHVNMVKRMNPRLKRWTRSPCVFPPSGKASATRRKSLGCTALPFAASASPNWDSWAPSQSAPLRSCSIRWD